MKTVPAIFRFISKRWQILILLIVSYLPILFTKPGRVSADTKTYLFLNPGELLSEASSLWSSSVGAGTVTHQYIGYLWPMGPYFWLMDAIGLPDWFAQRLWWGSLIFLASYGAYRLARAVHIGPNFALLAALLYGLSPYSLHYLARLSGILLPWVGLPWLLLCLVRARQQPGWKWHARSALIIGTIGTVNATALFFIIVGIGTWLACDALAGFARWRNSLYSFLKIGVTSTMVSLWWIASLTMQSAYGLPILRYTETYDTVAKASLPQELLRGLGYWFFYGDEYGGRWVGSSAPYMYNRLVIVAGFFVAAVGLIALATTRMRYRIHLGALTLIGLAISVGASPLDATSFYGRLFEQIVNQESGFALRSTPRALPLVLIALALASASAVENLCARIRRVHFSSFPNSRLTSVALRSAIVVSVVGAIAINNFPWFTQRAMTQIITRDETLPTYWTDAAQAIDATRDEDGFARTYEFPASNFADYWWGGTVDPILPGIIKSEYLSKEMVPQGSEATTDLLSAFESKVVDGRADLSVLRSLAALLSANTVTWRADLAYDRHLTARPEYLAPSLATAPPGESLFRGPIISTSDRVAIVDESWYGNTTTENYPLLEVWKIPTPRPLLTQSGPQGFTTVVGSGEGVINALSSELLSSSDTFIYAGSFPYLPAGINQSRLERVIVTDTNRKAQRQWSSIAQQTGRTEQANESLNPRPPTDQRLNPFTDNYRAHLSTDHMSTSRLIGDIERVTASTYGHPSVLTPEARPENAIDGDPRTSWVIGVRSSAVNEWIQINYRRPVQTSTLEFDLSNRQPGGRQIFRGRVDFTDSNGNIVSNVPVEFDQRDKITVRFPEITFHSLRFTIEDESLAKAIDYSTAPGIGIGEISISGVSSQEFIAVPQASLSLLKKAQNSSFVLARQFVDPSIPHRSDAETHIQRIIALPSQQTFSVSGRGQLSGRATEAVLSRFTQLALASSSSRVFGSANSVASLAVDGDTNTAWITPFDTTTGSQISLSLSPSSVSRELRLHVRNDQFHSLPRVITVADARNTEYSFELIDDDGKYFAELPAEFVFPLTSLRIDDIDQKTFRNYFTRAPRILPVAIMEIEIGAPNPVRQINVSSECRDDLLFVNDTAVPLRIISPNNPLDTTQFFKLESCGDVSFVEGENFIRTAKGLDIGFDVNQLILQSPDNSFAPEAYSPLALQSRDATKITANISTSTPQIVSFGQSINRGWKATLRTQDSTIDLGQPFVVQGYANGWLVPESGVLTLEWTPQRVVSMSLLVSLFSALVVVGLAWRRPRIRADLENEETLTSQNSTSLSFPIALVICGVVLMVAGIWATIIALMLSRVARRWSALAIGILVFVVAGVIVVQQTRYGYPSTLDWPLRFADLAPLAWIAVAIASINALLHRK